MLTIASRLDVMNRLGRAMSKKLKVFAGPDHPDAAQKPASFEITQLAQ